MKGLILAGGHGTRLRPLTHTGPKQLIPIANKANILYCLEDLRDAGITDIGVILGDIMPEKVRELLGDGSAFGVRITYLVQGFPAGIAHAIQCAESFMGPEPFCAYLGDNVLKGGIRPMVEEFEAHRYDAEVMLCHVPNPEKFGVAELDGQGHIVSLVEKPKAPKSDLALVGIYLLRTSIFPIIHDLKPSWRNELEITEALDHLRVQGGKLKAHIVTGWWKDTGKPEDILEANHLLLEDIDRKIEGTVEAGARGRDRARLHRRTRDLCRAVHVHRGRLAARRRGHRVVHRDRRGGHRDAPQDREQPHRPLCDDPFRRRAASERPAADHRGEQFALPVVAEGASNRLGTRTYAAAFVAVAGLPSCTRANQRPTAVHPTRIGQP